MKEIQSKVRRLRRLRSNFDTSYYARTITAQVEALAFKRTVHIPYYHDLANQGKNAVKEVPMAY